MADLLATAGPSPLWYATRGAGLVALVLLTASVCLGILNQVRWTSPRWPRLVLASLHRNISLLVLLVLALHIVTAEADTYAPVGWPAVLVPFASSYRPIWLGLGTLAFDLYLAVAVTSVLRDRIGYRAWRVVHWCAYASWPVAIVHGLGTGTDARSGWVQVLTVGCVLAAAAAVGARLVAADTSPRSRRLSIGAVALAVALAVGMWAEGGPLRPGWARRSGTPSHLLTGVPSTGRSRGLAPGCGEAAAGRSTSGPGTPRTHQAAS